MRRYHLKTIALAAISAAVLLSIVGCTASQEQEETTSNEVAQSQETQSAETEEATEETEPLSEEEAVLYRSNMSLGDPGRMQAVLERIKNGDPVTVGFIGGSITEGYNAKTTEIFAKLVTDHLNETYSGGKNNVTFVNAGISGTPSMLGLVRSERDLLASKPDLVFIEFAVNDAQTFTDKQAYDSLIYKCLKQDNDPAVVLLFSRTREDYSCQDNMSVTGFYYSLPMISVRNAINPEIEAGRMTWDDWSKDEAHPNEAGHRLYADMINYMIDREAAKPATEPVALPDKLKYNKDWSDLAFYDSDNLTVDSLGAFEESNAHNRFQGSFSYNAENGNDPFTFSFTGNTLFVVYKAEKSKSYASAEVLVDGEVKATLNASREDGWGNPVTALVFTDKESADHKIEIRVIESEEGKKFDLLAFGMQ